MKMKVKCGEKTVPEYGKKSNFERMDEMEQEQHLKFKDSTYVRHQHDGIDFWKRNLRRAMVRALDGLDMKLPWIMLTGMLILAVDDLLKCFPSWVSDMGAVIALMGAVQYVISIGLKIYRKKKNGE